MIGLGLNTSDTGQISVGNIEIGKVYVGETLVWPDKPVIINGLDSNGHDYTDMGEAGIWATCNVGASKPEGTGDYFAFGETTTKSNFSPGGYKYAKDYDWVAGQLGSVTKYCNLPEYGDVDDKLQLDIEDDAAHARLGGDWLIPSMEDFYKLFTYCNAQSTSVNGVQGTKFTLKTDSSKSIFIPYTGSKYGTSAGQTTTLVLNTCQINPGMSTHYFDLFADFDSSARFMYYVQRSNGLTIRPILKKYEELEKIQATVAVNNTLAGEIRFGRSAEHTRTSLTLLKGWNRFDFSIEANDGYKLNRVALIYQENPDDEVRGDLTTTTTTNYSSCTFEGYLTGSIRITAHFTIGY